jgi:TIR domain
MQRKLLCDDSESAMTSYDVFVSHASEDKNKVARPLAACLESLGLRVWFDECQLALGDSLRRNIDRGLSESRFGVVILSPAFFAKEWPSRPVDLRSRHGRLVSAASVGNRHCNANVGKISACWTRKAVLGELARPE